MNQTDNRYTLLYGLTLFGPDDRTPLCSVEEVADFLLTHDGGIITEPDGAALLEVEDREFVRQLSFTAVMLQTGRHRIIFRRLSSQL